MDNDISVNENGLVENLLGFSFEGLGKDLKDLEVKKLLQCDGQTTIICGHDGTFCSGGYPISLKQANGGSKILTLPLSSFN